MYQLRGLYVPIDCAAGNEFHWSKTSNLFPNHITRQQTDSDVRKQSTFYPTCVTVQRVSWEQWWGRSHPLGPFSDFIVQNVSLTPCALPRTFLFPPLATRFTRVPSRVGMGMWQPVSFKCIPAQLGGKVKDRNPTWPVRPPPTLPHLIPQQKLDLPNSCFRNMGHTGAVPGLLNSTDIWKIQNRKRVLSEKIKLFWNEGYPLR